MQKNNSCIAQPRVVVKNKLDNGWKQCFEELEVLRRYEDSLTTYKTLSAFVRKALNVP